MSAPAHAWREELRPGDEDLVRRLVQSTGFFTAEEVDIAVELVAERRQRGAASGYDFVFGELDGATIGYACFGRIAGTEASFDLYWIAIAAELRGRGHGTHVLRAAEQRIARAGGKRIYVETSSRAGYAETRAFYERKGYEKAAELPDFYREGDGKVIYCKILDGHAGHG